MQEHFIIPEEITQLIVDFLNGSIQEEEIKKLNRWITESKEHEKQFNSFKAIWLMSGKSIEISTEKSEIALGKINQKLSNNNVRQLQPFWRFWRIAASWLIFFVIGGVASSLFIDQPAQLKINPKIQTKITSPLGSISVVDLPDGTKVWLNAGSKITYDDSYGKSAREVQLTGEAYFNVRTNKHMPFIVKTSDIIVKALGTKFNVKAYPDEKTITATLEEGKIEVISLLKPDSKKPIILKPSEMVTYYKQDKMSKVSPIQTTKEKTAKGTDRDDNLEMIPNIKTELITSWKDETWIIESEPLGKLAPVLERRFNMEITFESGEIMNYKFTGRIQNETIEQILMAIELSAPIQYRFEKNRIILSANKMRKQRYDKFTN